MSSRWWGEGDPKDMRCGLGVDGVYYLYAGAQMKQIWSQEEHQLPFHRLSPQKEGYGVMNTREDLGLFALSIIRPRMLQT